MSDLNIEEQEFKDKELEAIEPIFTSPEPETEVLDGRGMIYEITDEELE